MLRLHSLQCRTLPLKQMLYAVPSLAWAASSLTARPGKARLQGACCLGEIRKSDNNNLKGVQWTGTPAFWHHLRLGRSVQTDVPLQRWDSDAHHDPAGAMGKAYVRAAAFCQAGAKLSKVRGSA